MGMRPILRCLLIPGQSRIGKSLGDLGSVGSDRLARRSGKTATLKQERIEAVRALQGWASRLAGIWAAVERREKTTSEDWKEGRENTLLDCWIYLLKVKKYRPIVATLEYSPVISQYSDPT